ncbi:MAG: DNA-processing protein DprA [Oscillospiraceae bacterium]
MLKYWLWLCNLPGLTNQTRLSLLQRFGTPEDIFFAETDEILLTEGIRRAQAALLENKDLKLADEIMGDCDGLGLRVVTMQDADYPNRLRNIYDPPCLLYTRGRFPMFDDEVAIAVVGTRDATPYGIDCAEKLSYGMARDGALIVSGLARGVDAAAHRAALRAGGITAAVLGSGIDVVYPRENAYLYQDIAATGVLISPYPPGTEPKPAHFPARNRIISGLCLATLVTEAPVQSGALITAATALEQSRDVFAVPGPIDAKNSQGCNRLIRDGAGLVSEPWDILRDYVDRYPGKLTESGRAAPENLGYAGRQKAAVKNEEKQEEPSPEKVTLSLSQNDLSLTDDQIRLLQAMGDTPIQADDLIELTQIPARRVLSALTVLEIEALVVQESGKRFSRTVTLAE